MALSQSGNLQSGGGLQASPAARLFMARFFEAAKFALSQRRPWAEMVDRNAFAKPESLAEASSRLKKNLTYFRINYIIVLLGVVALSLLWNLGSFIVLALLVAAWVLLYFFRTEPLVLFNRTFSEREVLILLSAFSVLVIFITNIGSLLIWAGLFGSLLIAVHGALRVPDDLFLDDQEAPGGFLSFLGTGAPPAPVVVSHV